MAIYLGADPLISPKKMGRPSFFSRQNRMTRVFYVAKTLMKGASVRK
jgi:hypothetical protein